MKTIAFINSTVNKKFAENYDMTHLTCGEANGYVAVPPEHPLYGKDFNDIDDINVHGGLTCSGHISEYFMEDMEFISDATEVPSGWWILGFDTMHDGDNNVNWPKERVKEETLRLQEQLEKIMEMKIKTNSDYIRMKAQIAVLKEVSLDYQGKTIDNIIRQMEARVKEFEKGGEQ